MALAPERLELSASQQRDVSALLAKRARLVQEAEQEVTQIDIRLLVLMRTLAGSAGHDADELTVAGWSIALSSAADAVELTPPLEAGSPPIHQEG